MTGYQSHIANQAALAHALIAAGHLDEPRDVVYFFEKPYKWVHERELWMACGRPGDRTDDGWARFVDGLEQLESKQAHTPE